MTAPQPRPTWPRSLSDTELEKLVRRLDAAVRTAADGPPSYEADELVTASAVARIELRRRRAQQRAQEARRALLSSGWSA